MEQCCANCQHLCCTTDGEDYCDYQQDYVYPADRYCCDAWSEADDQVYFIKVFVIF